MAISRGTSLWWQVQSRNKKSVTCDLRTPEGPVMKTGAVGPFRSVYVRDPDLNLVEMSVYNP